MSAEFEKFFSRSPNRWRGFLLGALGGIAGIFAMQYYWKAVKSITGEDPRSKKKEEGEQGPLDDISLVGKNHQPGESSTAAMGRILYTKITGKPPKSEETKTMLSYTVHWAISMLAGGLYGAAQEDAGFPDIKGSLALGTGLWLFGDEIGVALLGLTDGPTAYPFETHFHSRMAHMVYGLATGLTTQALIDMVE